MNEESGPIEPDEIIDISDKGHIDDLIKEGLTRATPQCRKSKGAILTDAKPWIMERVTPEMKEATFVEFMDWRSAKLLGTRITAGQIMFLEFAKNPPLEFFKEMPSSAQLELNDGITIPFMAANEMDFNEFAERLATRKRIAQDRLEELIELIKKAIDVIGELLRGGKVLGDVVHGQ